MKTYKNINEGFKEIQRKALTRTIPLVALALVVGVGIPSGGNPGEVNTWPYLMLLLSGALAFGIFKGLNRQRKIFESYLLTIDDDFIQRDQLNTPTVKILKDEIKEIIAYPKGGFAIAGKTKADLIVVTKYIDGFTDVENSLKQLKEFSTPSKKSTIEVLSPFLAVFGLALMAIVYISTNKSLVLVSGTILTILLSWSLYEIQISKNIDSKTKKNSWWTIIVLLSVIGITYSKVAG
jgi:hypothetical protein